MIKKLLRTALLFFAGLILILALAYIFPTVQAPQNLTVAPVPPQRDLDSLFFAMQMDSLKIKFGNRKILPQGYELQTLVALSYFPELKDVRINFRYKKAFIPLSSRPNLFSMLASKKNWEYRVIVSSESIESMEPILLKNLPFNAQVGILAHELAHTAHYQQYNFWQLLKFGMRYTLDSKFRALHERSTDEKVVYQGLGWQLLDYAKFIRTDPTTVQHYEASKDFLDKNYLKPAEVLEVMSRIPGYKLSTLAE